MKWSIPTALIMLVDRRKSRGRMKEELDERWDWMVGMRATDDVHWESS